VRIIHGVLSLDVGGLERIVIALARAQVQAGHDVTIVCVEKPGRLAAEAGVPVLSLDKPPGRPSEFSTHASKTLLRLQPDVLHTHQIGAAFHLARHQVRTVHTEHGNAFARAASWGERIKLRWLYRRVARRVDRFACVSAEISDAVAAWGTVPQAMLCHVPNGIPTPVVTDTTVRAKLGIPATAFVVGTVGRLNEVKRQDVLLRGVAAVPGAWALIVGDGPEDASLRSHVKALAIEDRCVFAGYQAEPANFLHAMDVFALTSRSEGLPVTLLEAWALAKPVVCSAVGGLAAAVSSNINGRLVPPGEVTGFADAFAFLMRDPGAGIAWGLAGRLNFESHYTLAAMQRAYDRLYCG
jgi:glycosyltransferase involved in cell wall biosynthesis